MSVRCCFRNYHGSSNLKQFIVADTIIEVFDRYNIDFSVKACQAGPDAHKLYRWFSSNSTMEEVHTHQDNTLSRRQWK